MELLKEVKIDPKNPIPVFGIESSNGSQRELNDVEKIHRIAESAYYKAEARGFESGHDMEDWFAAEAEEGQ